MNPKVSVIVPFYNSEKYIERCARSLFAQTLKELEFIFVNDCSTDGSLAILQSVMREYPEREAQSIILSLERNSGLAEANHRAHQVMSGDFFIRCDSDDDVDVRAYELLYNKAIEEGADIVFCDKYIVRDGRMKRVKAMDRKCRFVDRRFEMLHNTLVLKGLPTLWSVLSSRELLKSPLQYPERSMGEDVMLILQMAYYSKKVSYLDVPLYHYYQNSDSICNTMTESSIMRRYDDAMVQSGFMVDFIIRNGLGKEFRKEIVASKNAARSFLYFVMNSKEMFDRWAHTYPEIYWKVPFNPYVTLKEKKAVVSKMIRRTLHLYSK